MRLLAARRGFVLCLPAFLLLAALNAGGYSYGTADQAFYQPVVLIKLNPSLFPRDAPVIRAQAPLTEYDEVIAGIVRVTRLSLPAAFAALHVASLVCIAAGVWLIGGSLFRSRWGAAALLFAMTLRHSVPRTALNTLDNHFHPRQLAFGLGVVAVAAFLRGRLALMTLVVLAAASIHPTSTFWFAVWLAAAVAIERPPLRRRMAIAAVPMAALGAWALTAGPLSGRLVPMDAEWMQMLAGKQYLFPLQWPAHVWALHAGCAALMVTIFRARRRQAMVSDRERALVLGTLSLAALFAVALAAQAFGVALAFQMQPARILLVFDLVATIYFVRAVVEYAPAWRWQPQAVAAVIAAVSLSRGVHMLASGRVEMAPSVRDNDWGRVMAWARTTEAGSGWLADPLHASKYGTSVRVAAERDVFVELEKDSALGIYDREIARRTDERYRKVRDFACLSADAVRALGREYDLDYLVTENALSLPLAFQSGLIRVYRLR